MKVYPFKISKPLHENLLVQVDTAPIFFDKLHQHDEIQIAHIVKGEGKLFISDTVHPYWPGDTFVIAGNSPHLFQSMEIRNSLSHMISIFFTKESFGDGFFDIPQLVGIIGFFEKSAAGFRLTEHKPSIEKIMCKLPQADKFSRFVLFLKLLHKLRNTKTEPLTNALCSKTISTYDAPRMQRILDYVKSNFQHEITLEKVAELACMTPNAFCNFFKQRTDKTFFQFLITLRIEHSCQLIANNIGLSISAISTESGFKSISNFNRKFKELKGMTPSQYFQKMNDSPVYCF